MKSNAVFLDELTVISFLFILKKNNISDVLVLCKRNISYNFFSFLLKLKGIKTTSILFFQGDYKTPKGESIFFQARRLDNKIAFIESKNIFEQSLALKKISLSRSSIPLAIAKNLQIYSKYWTDRCSLVSEISKDYDTFSILIKNPLLFNPNHLKSCSQIK